MDPIIQLKGNMLEPEEVLPQAAAGYHYTSRPGQGQALTKNDSSRRGYRQELDKR